MIGKLCGDLSAPLPYSLIRSNRRSISLSVAQGGALIVRAPLLMPKGLIDRFVLDKRDWIKKQLSAVASRPARSFCAGETLPFHGETLLLHPSETARTIKRTENRLSFPAADCEQTQARLEGWYRTQAKEIFRARIAYFAPIVGVSPGPIRVSGAATRWGSCGKADSINLNWRLLLAPPEVLDYVVVHELCHIGQRDHSKAFWARVALVLPDYAKRRAYLHTHRAELEL